MRRVHFVTKNDYKYDIAKKVLGKSAIMLIQEKLDTPEIQNWDVCKIASFSAKWAAEKLGKSVAVTDAGYYIEALKGFPGPFIKFTNQCFTANDYSRLMEGKKNRKVVIKGCLAYCEPGNEPVTFESSTKATIAMKPGPKGATPINEIFIPEGFDKTESQIPREEMVKFWAKIEKYWQKLADYLDRK